MRTMKTSDLTGAALDWAVAKCEGIGVWYDDLPQMLRTTKGGAKEYAPSDNWAQGGPIIEREKISLEFLPGAGDTGADVWIATRIERPAVSEEQGPTPLIAAMRCFVASKLGEIVEVPRELYKEDV